MIIVIILGVTSIILLSIIGILHILINKCSINDDTFLFLLVILSVFAICFIISFFIVGGCYLQSSKRIDFINKTYDTNYTTEEYFWNNIEIDDIIDDIKRSKR